MRKDTSRYEITWGRANGGKEVSELENVFNLSNKEAFISKL